MKTPLVLLLLLSSARLSGADEFTDALDLPGANWTHSSASSPWVTGADSLGDYAEVTNLPAGMEAWLETTVSGPAVLQVEGEGPREYNGPGYYMEVFRDGEEQTWFHPDVRAQITVPAGSHTVRILLSSWPSTYPGYPGTDHRVRVRSVTLLPPSEPFVAEGLDTPGRTWFFTGSWATQLDTGHDGVDSLFIESGEFARLETEVTGPATVSFWQSYSSTEEGDAEFDPPAGATWGEGLQRFSLWVPPGQHWVKWFIEGDGGHLTLDEFTATPSATVSLAEATDTVGVAGIGGWVTSPENPWIGAVTPIAPDGVDFAAVTTTEGAPAPWIETTAQGPGRLRWKGAGEASPTLSLNGTNLGGMPHGQAYGTAFLPTGTNTLRWTAGDDTAYAALDKVQFETFSPSPVAEALDSTLTFTTGGIPPIGVATAVDARDGEDYLLFPSVPAGSTSWIETTVTGPGTLEFYLQQDVFFPEITISQNGVPLLTTGDGTWQLKRIEVPAGASTIRWTFEPGAARSAMLDGVVWAPGVRAFSDALEFHDWTLISSGFAVNGGTLQPTGNPQLLQLSGYGAGVFEVAGTDYGAVSIVSPDDDDEQGRPRAEFSAARNARLFLDSGLHVLQITSSNGLGAVDRITLTNSEVSLAEALDAPGRVFTTGGSAPWRGYVLPDALLGGDSAASPQVQPGQSAWLESSFTGPGVVSFVYRGIVWDPQEELVIRVDGAPVQIIGPVYDPITAASVALPVGEHAVRWEFRRAPTATYANPYILMDGVTFSSGPDISAALDIPARGWMVTDDVQTGLDSGEDVALLGGGTISTVVEGPATIAFRWISTTSLSVVWSGPNESSFQPPAAGKTWQDARLVLPAGLHTVLWTGTGALDAVSITPGAPAADALDLHGIDWRALLFTGQWDTVSETNRLGGTVMRSRLSVPGSNKLSLFLHQGGALLNFDWRRAVSAPGSSGFSASVLTSPSIPPATNDWSTATMPILYGWRELVWTHTSTTGNNEEARLDAVTASPESYFRWANAHGIGHLPQEADSDGDGVANLLEFATGSDPGDAASAVRPLPKFTPQPGGMMQISWMIPVTAYSRTGLRWFFRYTPDLRTWGESPVTTASDGSIYVGLGYQSRQFYQLRADYAP
jgi:hypothetical protein